MAMINCDVIIEGNVIGISRSSGDQVMKYSFYNGRNEKNDLMCQVVKSPCGLDMHLCGKTKSRNNDCNFYIRGRIIRRIYTLHNFDNGSYCIYGDSVNSARWVLYIIFSG